MTRARPHPLGEALASRPGADVVDLACGDGALARRAVGWGAASVLALDLDPDLLDRARVAARLAGGDVAARVHHEQADLEQATLPFEAYDVAWAPGVLARTPDPVRLARMVRAGLRPHGLLLATVPADGAEVARAVDALGRADLREATVDAVDDDVVLLQAAKPPRGRAR